MNIAGQQAGSWGSVKRGASTAAGIVSLVLALVLAGSVSGSAASLFTETIALVGEACEGTLSAAVDKISSESGVAKVASSSGRSQFDSSPQYRLD